MSGYTSLCNLRPSRASGVLKAEALTKNSQWICRGHYFRKSGKHRLFSTVTRTVEFLTKQSFVKIFNFLALEKSYARFASLGRKELPDKYGGSPKSRCGEWLLAFRGVSDKTIFVQVAFVGKQQYLGGHFATSCSPQEISGSFERHFSQCTSCRLMSSASPFSLFLQLSKSSLI